MADTAAPLRVERVAPILTEELGPARDCPYGRDLRVEAWPDRAAVTRIARKIDERLGTLSAFFDQWRAASGLLDPYAVYGRTLALTLLGGDLREILRPAAVELAAKHA